MGRRIINDGFKMESINIKNKNKHQIHMQLHTNIYRDAIQLQGGRRLYLLHREGEAFINISTYHPHPHPHPHLFILILILIHINFYFFKTMTINPIPPIPPPCTK